MKHVLTCAAVLTAAIGVCPPAHGGDDGAETYPQVEFDGGRGARFDVESGCLTVQSLPRSILTNADGQRITIEPALDSNAHVLQLDALIAADGTLVGGVPGDDFRLVGAIDADGDGTIDYSGVLLTGEIAEFDFTAEKRAAGRPAPTRGIAAGRATRGADGRATLNAVDFSFRVTPTGGVLLPLTDGMDLGLAVRSVNSTFDGTFALDFAGGAQGIITTLDPPGACCFDDGSCLNMTPDLCADLGGTFIGSRIFCSSVNCAPTGACCLSDGTCLDDQSAEACAANGGTYQGDDTLCQDTECPQPNGACCLNDGACIEATEEECAAQNGAFYGDFSTCQDTECPQPNGACCLNDGSCIEATEEECAAQSGSFYGDFSTCQDTDCPQPNGACCLSDGSCVEATEEECAAQNGAFYGDFSTCQDTDCPQPNGACCLSDGTCADVTDATCNAMGGTYQGNDTSCNDANCPQPEGACCLSDGACVEATEAACVDAGGAYFGDDTTCNDVACEQPGACCLDDGTCAVVHADECLALGGAFNGAGVSCNDVVTYVYDRSFAWGESQNNAYGNTDRIIATFTPATGRLTWESIISPNDETFPNAFSNVINDGPNPNGIPGELAQFYYDFSGLGGAGAPVLTVYAYNGAGNNSSWFDGDGNPHNGYDADCIASSLSDDGWINELIHEILPDGRLRVGFDIDATAIIDHMPAFPSGAPWTGAQFDDLLGYWFHPMVIDDTAYDDGCLAAFSGVRGWVDTTNEPTEDLACIPVTGACCLDDGCVIATEIDCVLDAGTWYGAGTTCDDLVTFVYDRDLAPGETQNPAAGRVDEIHASFNPWTQRLVWEATFEPHNGMLPDATTLVLNHGPNPKSGETGVYAMAYLDATDRDAPVLTVYGYNAVNNLRSHVDGDGISGNDPNADRIASSLLDPSWINELIVIEHGDGRLTLGFDIDASVINGRLPAYPTPGVPWYGMQFNHGIGYWFHAVKNAQPIYVGGWLVNFAPAVEGWLDVTNHETLVDRACLPAPQLLLHYDFEEQDGDVVYDRVGAIDLDIIEDDGWVEWVSDEHGGGLRFHQNAFGDCRAQTATEHDADPLLDALRATNAMTIQITFAQDDGVTTGSRLFTWSGSTHIDERNVSILGEVNDNDSDVFDLKARLATSDGTTNHGPDQCWDEDEVITLTMTYSAIDDPVVRVYANGVLIDSVPHGGTFETWSSYHLLLGNELTQNRPFGGTIYDVRIWNHVLVP